MPELQTVVPKYVAMCKPWLQDKDLLSQEPQRYTAEAWLNRFPSFPYLQAVLAKYPQHLNRSNVAAYAPHSTDSSLIPQGIWHLFWATMLWGWATAPNGPQRVSRIFRDVAEPEIISILTEAFQCIQSGEIRSAYQCFLRDGKTQIKHLNEAFFSKFLYFAGLGCGLKTYPLIYDSKVNQALVVLMGKDAPRQYNLEGYLRYVDLMHDWATALECRADSLEYLLYTLPPDFWKRT